jgi:hypothetical protein
MNRSHEGCGEEWESGDVVGLRLCLDDQLDAGALLEGLGEMPLLAECHDVVVKGLELRSAMIATPKAVYLRPFLEVRLVAELLTVPKREMV